MIHGTLKQHEIAISRLENPEEYKGLPDLEDKRRRIRIWRYPSFSIISSWTIFGLGNKLVLRRIEWDRFSEFPSQSEITQIFAAQSNIEETAFNVVMEELSKIEFKPLIEHQYVICDGTEYGIEVGHGAYSRSVSWHSTPPKGWENLAVWHEKAIAFFDSCLPESTCRANEENS